MQQINRSIYLVQSGEEVTIEVEATKVGNFVTFALDGGSINPVSSTPITYKFKVTVGSGLTHFGMILCHFPKDAPNDSKFEIFVSGDKGGGKFTGSDIFKTDLGWNRSIEFRRA